MSYGSLFAYGRVLYLNEIADMSIASDCAVWTDMYVRSYCNTVLDNRIVSLSGIHHHIVPYRAVFNYRERTYLTAASYLSTAAEYRIRKYLASCTYLDVPFDDNAVCTGEFNTVCKVLVNDCHTCIGIELQQILPVICALYYVCIIGLVRTCILALCYCKRNSICEIILILCIIVCYLAEKIDKVRCVEPVSSRIYFPDSLLLVSSVLLLYYTAYTALCTDYPSVAEGIIEFCCDDCNSIAVLLVEHKGFPDSLSVDKRCIAAEYKCIAVRIFLKERDSLHYCVTCTESFCLKRSGIPAAKILVYHLAFKALYHADIAYS